MFLASGVFILVEVLIPGRFNQVGVISISTFNVYVDGFMPFITEEIWSNLRDRGENQDIIVSTWPIVGGSNTELSQQAEDIFELVSQIRNLRASKGLSPKEALPLYIKAKARDKYEQFEQIIKKLSNVESITFVEEKVEKTLSFIIQSDEFYIPLPEGSIDLEAEKAELIKELNYTRGFLKGVEKKLSNERFVDNAPEQVVAIEKKKQADAQSRIKVLEEKLAVLS